MRQWGAAWRLIYDWPTRSGALNMAIDEALLASVSAGDQPPTIRLYGWSPPCVSLGYGQRSQEIDWDRARSLGWDVVRRPTGGRAILHTDELTYSVACPLDHPLAAGGILPSYQRISHGLITGLEQLGLAASASRDVEEASMKSPVCFDQPGRYEITYSGKKLIGSAQVRRNGGMLQHGTLPLTGDISRLCDALVYTDERSRSADRQRVQERAVTLEDALGEGVTWQRAADAIALGFTSTFAAGAVHDSLSDDEYQSAKGIAGTRYATGVWTRRR